MNLSLHLPVLHFSDSQNQLVALVRPTSKFEPVPDYTLTSKGL